MSRDEAGLDETDDGRTPPGLIGTWTLLAAGAAATSTGAILLGHQAGIDVLRLTRDPSAVTGSRATNGAISQLGVICWATCVGAFVVTAMVSERSQRHRAARIAAANAVLALVLCCDDAFLIHEAVGDVGDAAAVAVIGFYGLIGLAWLAVTRPWQRLGTFAPVVLSLTLLAGSALTDLTEDLSGQAIYSWGNVIDDAFKVGGIAAFVIWTLASVVSMLPRV
ncbi:MAG: hypothetical protein AB7V43_21900 [Acidimicrobiia bacterium]